MKFNALALLFALALCTSAVAEDAPAKKKKKNAGNRNNPAMNVMKQLKDLELTDEQKTQIEALAKKSMAGIKEAQTATGLTPEILKKRAAAQKELKDSGKKQKELATAVNEKAGLTEKQIAGIKKTSELRSAMMKSVVGLLTDDQKAKLPERMARFSKAKSEKGKGKGKGKKKKAKDAA